MQLISVFKLFLKPKFLKKIKNQPYFENKTDLNYLEKVIKLIICSH